jgi:hypothetical protein
MNQGEQQLIPARDRESSGVRSEWGRRWPAAARLAPAEVPGAGRPQSLDDAEVVQ